MKTFKGTVPELPMTDREKNPPRKEGKKHPGLGWVIAGITFSLISLMYWSTSSGFIKGISTYFWSSEEGTIMASDLRSHSTSGDGTVTYSVVIDGVTVEDTTEVFKKWSGNTQANYDEWASQYTQGSSATVYYSRSGETSLGRWPTAYSYQFGVQGVATLLMGLSFMYRGAKQIKARYNNSFTATSSLRV
ncbi:MAG: hypothetical protein AAGH40_05180 [Verrucomicrobiota bacterium]